MYSLFIIHYYVGLVIEVVPGKREISMSNEFKQLCKEENDHITVTA